MNPDFGPFGPQADVPQPSPGVGNTTTQQGDTVNREVFTGRTYTIDPWTGEKSYQGDKK